MRPHDISLNHKNVQKYHFETKWESMDEFKGWLKPIANDEKKAYCALCNTVMNADLLDLLTHGSSKKHLQIKRQNFIKTRYEVQVQKSSIENDSSEDNYSEDDLLNKKWNSSSIECLLKQLKTRWPDFSNSLRDKKDLWQGISNALETNGYFFSSTECEKQFENMKISFYNSMCKVNMDDQIVLFDLPYYNDLHLLLADKPESVLLLEESKSFPKLTTFKGEKIMERDQIPATIVNSHYTFDAGGDVKWTVTATNVFLKFLLALQDVLTGSEEDCNFPIWQSLSARMNQAGYDFDEVHCQTKWLSLVQKYNNYKEESKMTGILPLWPYFTNVRHIINKINFPVGNDWTKKISNKTVLGNVNSNKRRRITDTNGGEILLEEESIKRKPVKQKYSDHAVNRRIQQLTENAQVWDRLNNIENNLQELADQQEQQALTNSLLGQILTEISTLASYVAPKNSDLNEDITLIVPMAGD